MRVEVTRSAVIAAPLERVWAAVRDFGDHRRWHADLTLCRVENELTGDVVGCVRRCGLGEGVELREQLISHSDREHCYSYAVLDSSLPLFEGLTSLRLRPVTDSGHTFLQWSVRFRTPKARAGELKALLGRQLFEAGFSGLRSHLAQDGPAAPAEPAPLAEPALAAPGEDLPARVMVIESPGEAADLVLRDLMVPAPQARQVRIRQKAVAVNPVDLLHCRGQGEDMAFPGTPGLEGVGEIVDLGPQVNGLFPGDRVAWLSSKPGAYAELVLADSVNCIALPAELSDVEASTLYKGLTAGLLLGRVFRAGPGAAIMIESVDGGQGHIICQWARSLDLVVMGTASSREGALFARDLGCAHPIVLDHGTSLRDEIMRITNGRGADFWVFEGGCASLDEALGCMARFGHLAIVEGGNAQPANLAVDLLKRRSLTVSHQDCLHYLGDRLYMQRSAQNYFAKLKSGIIVPAVETALLSQAGEALQRYESGQYQGALSLIPGS